MYGSFRKGQFLDFVEELAGRLGTRHSRRRGAGGETVPALQIGAYWVALEHRMPHSQLPAFETKVSLDPGGSLDESGRLEIYPEHPGHAVHKFFGMQDHVLGDERFDPLFIVKGSLPPARIAEVIDPEIRRLLLETRDLEPLLSASPHQVALLVHELVLTDGLLRSMISAVTSVTQRLLGRSAAAEGVSEGRPAISRPSLEKAVPSCRVCGRSLTLFVVRCARCERPHHAECWSYSGVCSTYGCGGTERT